MGRCEGLCFVLWKFKFTFSGAFCFTAAESMVYCVCVAFSMGGWVAVTAALIRVALSWQCGCHINGSVARVCVGRCALVLDYICKQSFLKYLLNK